MMILEQQHYNDEKRPNGGGGREPREKTSVERLMELQEKRQTGADLCGRTCLAGRMTSYTVPDSLPF